MITMDGQYVTSRGAKVTLLTTDGPDRNYPVVGIIDGDSRIHTWNKSGSPAIRLNRSWATLRSANLLTIKDSSDVCLSMFDSRGTRLFTIYKDTGHFNAYKMSEALAKLLEGMKE